ncbi:hypothetical protein K466DRAFT_308785 [Polyporus arcularius HHB13444]|uniref:Uncharacterized protein n=1 Tax=Polyporus arcularius HHB13444 TaxID=1314778 RepID=A0A5C3NXS3_9APHY|nr:hypothetical protein K466DRAFT_308785 [Polyporus arcularius HHB13444]
MYLATVPLPSSRRVTDCIARAYDTLLEKALRFSQVARARLSPPIHEPTLHSFGRTLHIRMPPPVDMPSRILSGDVVSPSKPSLSGLPINDRMARASRCVLNFRPPKKPSLRHSDQYRGADHHRRLLDHAQNRPPDVVNVLDSTIPYTGWSSSRTPVAPAGRDRTLRPPPPLAYEYPVQSCSGFLSSAQRRCHPGPYSTAASSRLAPRPPRVLVGSRGRPDMRIFGTKVAERADTRRVQVS